MRFSSISGLLALLCASLQVATAAANCSVSVSSLAFGAHSTISGSPTDSTGTIGVTCSGNVGDSASYTILLGTGNGSFSSRQMSSGPNGLAYNIFADASYSSALGDGTNSTVTLSNSYALSSLSQTTNHAIYGRIFAGQTSLPAGSYSDTIVVTLEY